VTSTERGATALPSLARWRISLASAQVACIGGFVVLLMRPLHIPDPFGVGVSLSWTVICLVTAGVVLVPELLAGRWPATGLDRPLLAYAVIIAATSLTSLNWPETGSWILALTGNIGIFFAVVVMARRWAWVSESILLFLVASIALLLLMATGYHAEVGLLTRPKSYPVPEGWSGYPELATLGALQFGLLIAGIQTARRWTGVAAAAMLAVLTLAETALLYSRGAWLAVGAVLAVAGALLTGRGQLRRVVIGICLVVGLTGLLAAANPTFRHLLTGGSGDGNLVQVASPEMRVRLWTRALRMIADRPLTGVGLGNFRRVFETVYNPDVNEDRRRGVHAHNLWLQQYAEVGIFGGTVYLVLWIAILRQAWRRARGDPDFLSLGLLLSITALAATNLTTNMFFLPGLAAGRLHSACWMLFGLVAAHPRPGSRSELG
jgi:O-antigen ligase